MLKVSLIKLIANYKKNNKKVFVKDVGMSVLEAFLASNEITSRANDDEVSYVEFQQYLLKFDPNALNSIQSRNYKTTYKEGCHILIEFASAEKIVDESDFSKLPQDVIKYLRNNFLDTGNIVKLGCTSSFFYQLLKKPVNDEKPGYIKKKLMELGLSNLWLAYLNLLDNKQKIQLKNAGDMEGNLLDKKTINYEAIYIGLNKLKKANNVELFDEVRNFCHPKLILGLLSGDLDFINKGWKENHLSEGYLLSEQGKRCIHLFHLAVLSGNVDVVKHLIKERNQETHNIDRNGNVLYLAVKYDQLNIVKYLLEERKINPVVILNNRHGAVAYHNTLHFAVQFGHLDIVKYLIEEIKMDPNVKVGEYHRNALHFAAKCGQLNVVKYLVEERGLDPYIGDGGYGCNALHLASQAGHLDIVKYLIEEIKMDLNVKDNYNRNALSVAKSDVFKFIKQQDEQQYANQRVCLR